MHSASSTCIRSGDLDNRMLPTATSLYMRPPMPVPYNIGNQPYYSGGSYSGTNYSRPSLHSPVAVGPQSYYIQSPSSYQLPPRMPSNVGNVQHSSAQVTQQPLASNSATMNDDSPVTTRRFNTYKENREFQNTHSVLNASSMSVRHMGSSATSVQSGLPADFGQIVCPLLPSVRHGRPRS